MKRPDTFSIEFVIRVGTETFIQVRTFCIGMWDTVTMNRVQVLEAHARETAIRAIRLNMRWDDVRKLAEGTKVYISTRPDLTDRKVFDTPDDIRALAWNFQTEVTLEGFDWRPRMSS